MHDNVVLEDHVNKIHIKDKEALNRSIRLDDLTNGCSICPLKFLSQNILDTHTKLQHKILSKPDNTPKTSCCKLCSVSFKNTGMFKRHKLYLHEGRCEEIEAFKRDIYSAELVHKCDVCGSRFLTKIFLPEEEKHPFNLYSMSHCLQREKRSQKTCPETS